VTDPDLVAKRLALVETFVSDLRALARPERIAHDLVASYGGIRRRMASTNASKSSGRCSTTSRTI
jgi:hypothetical protein